MSDRGSTLSQARADYGHVRKAIAYISDNATSQPGLEEIAAHVGLSPGHLQRIFTRWAGLSPKAFLQAVTIDRARRLLRQSASVLDTAYEVGLSGPGRLHDLFISHEGMTPGAYKAKGRGLTIGYGFHDCPFGRAVVLEQAGALIGLAFADGGEEHRALDDMRRRWPAADYRESPATTAGLARRIFDIAGWRGETPLRITMIGSDFEVRVWQVLLRIPPGRVASYAQVAEAVGRRSAARAVGAAVGRNPISFVVPCHRVIASSGSLCGYHWGLTRKMAMLGWEAGLG